MTRDTKAKWCSGCGELEYYGHKLLYRAKVAACAGPKGFKPIPAYYLYACSSECLAKVQAGIAKDEADAQALARS
mgnify:CR=1 FL=1